MKVLLALVWTCCARVGGGLVPPMVLVFSTFTYSFVPHAVQPREPPRLSVPNPHADHTSVGHEMETAPKRRVLPVLPDSDDESFFEALRSAYEVANRRLEAGERDDERGVVVVEGIADFEVANGGLVKFERDYFGREDHVDVVVEDDNTCTIYLTKTYRRGHDIMRSTISKQIDYWSIFDAKLPDHFEYIHVSSGMAPQINILGKPTETSVDA